MRSCNFWRLMLNKVTLRFYSCSLKFSYFFWKRNGFLQVGQKLQKLIRKTEGILGVKVISDQVDLGPTWSTYLRKLGFPTPSLPWCPHDACFKQGPLTPWVTSTLGWWHPPPLRVLTSLLTYIVCSLPLRLHLMMPAPR
jgi:hypothetical protein